ncbi:hypothetical protein C2845_PM13G03090 [Panicum miliaceum]|uniref:Uncharacterized protein n=1 Tax=Panicum miliaceum TaxID=4540 RepID=A0A3L6RKI1_PANMI|nr:hypothetical protein C2845_PM13G03090 [Panicum miliaceum]
MPRAAPSSYRKPDDNQRSRDGKKDDNHGKYSKKGAGKENEEDEQNGDMDASQGDSQFDNMEDLIRDGTPEDCDSPLAVTPLAIAFPEGPPVQQQLPCSERVPETTKLLTSEMELTDNSQESFVLTQDAEANVTGGQDGMIKVRNEEGR